MTRILVKLHNNKLVKIKVTYRIIITKKEPKKFIIHKNKLGNVSAL